MIGSVLRLHRERLGLTQREVAERAGISHPYLGRIETGNRQPSWATVRRLIAALDDAAEVPLLLAAGYYAPPDPLAEEQLRAFERYLATVSPTRRRALMRAFDILMRIA